MTKPVLYTLHTIAAAWGISYVRVWQLYAKGRMPEPDGNADGRPIWYELPDKPERKKRVTFTDTPKV
jgi:hypothetical protein